LIIADTSVVIAAFATWHHLHRQARRVIDRGPRLPAPVALETYSMLTRLPPPHRVAARAVAGFLADRFERPYLAMRASRYGSFLDGLPVLRIQGGATYDALVAAIAVEAGATLVSCDHRAAGTYERFDVTVEYLA
jgi:predicted nucleic acid-binding protein